MEKVRFSRPNLTELKKEQLSCVDMHLHTEYSYDSSGNIRKALAKAKRLGFGIAVTDHNTIDGAVYAVENSDGVLVIPGIEVKAYNGVDIVIYFYDIEELKQFFHEEIEPFCQENAFISRLSEEEIITRARRYRCCISVPHPYAYRYLGVGAVIDRGVTPEGVMADVDLVEGINGHLSRRANKQGLEFAKKHNKALIAGSDAHCTRNVGDVLTCVKLREGEHFLDALKRQETYIVGREKTAFSLLVHLICSQFRIFTRGGWKMFKEHTAVCFSAKRRTLRAVQKVAV